MVINIQHKVLASISTQRFTSKPTDDLISNQTFKEREIDLRSLAIEASQGHSICNLFNLPLVDGCFAMSGRNLNNLRGAYMVFVDIDNAIIDMDKFINKLSMKPSFAYYSFSDHLDRDDLGRVIRRFHMVYVLDSMIDRDQYKGIYKALSALISDETGHCPDKMSNSAAKLLFGGSSTYKVTNCIYSVSDFDVRQEYMEFQKEEDTTQFADAFDPELVNDVKGLFVRPSAYKSFAKKWYEKGYPIINEPEYTFEEDVTQRPGDYLKIRHNPHFTIQDGCHRRHKLYAWACIRRTFSRWGHEWCNTHNGLLVAAAYEFAKYIDNSKDAIKPVELLDIVNRVMKLDMKDVFLACAETKQSTFITNPRLDKKTRLSLAASAMHNNNKRIKDEVLGNIYYEGISVNEMVEVANDEFGYKVSARTVYRWIESNTLSTSTKVVYTQYDPNKSLRENAEAMGCSTKKVRRLRDEYLSVTFLTVDSTDF